MMMLTFDIGGENLMIGDRDDGHHNGVAGGGDDDDDNEQCFPL